MRKVYIALDPGKTGAIAIQERNWTGWLAVEIFNLARYEGDIEKLRGFYVMLRNRYEYGYEVYMAVENVHAAPRDTPKTAFNFGFNYGVHLALIRDILYKDPLKVAPRTWQLFHGVGAKYATSALRKKAHLEVAKKIAVGTKGLSLKTGDAVCILKWLIAHTKGIKNASNATSSKPARRKNEKSLASDNDGSDKNVRRIGTRKRIR